MSPCDRRELTSVLASKTIHRASQDGRSSIQAMGYVSPPPLIAYILTTPFTEQHLIAERDRLNRDLESAHTSIKNLETELDAIGFGRGQGSMASSRGGR